MSDFDMMSAMRALADTGRADSPRRGLGPIVKALVWVRKRVTHVINKLIYWCYPKPMPVTRVYLAQGGGGGGGGGGYRTGSIVGWNGHGAP